MLSEPDQLPRPRVLRNSAFNLLGVVVPALVAVLCTPALFSALGRSGFGVFSIQLAVLVVIGVNDFGLSRAMVLEAVSRGAFADKRQLVLVLRACLELIVLLAAAVAVGGALVLAATSLGMSLTFDQAASWALLIASSATSLLTLPLRASLEVQERFGLMNTLRLFGSSSVFIGPLLALAVEPTLLAASWGLLISRVVTLALFAIATLSSTRDISLSESFASFRSLLLGRLPSLHSKMVHLAGWLGAAGLASMLIGYSDRFALGFMAPTATVGDYTVVSELVTKMWMVTGALISAATPRIAHGWRHGPSENYRKNFFVLVSLLALVAISAHFVLLFFGDVFLRLWLRESYRPEMFSILKVLSVGIAVNAVSMPNFLLLFLGGREKIAAYVQIAILPVTFIASLVAAYAFGATGVAWVFTSRLILDLIIVRWLVPKTPEGHSSGVPMAIGIGWVVLCIGLYAIADDL